MGFWSSWFGGAKPSAAVPHTSPPAETARPAASAVASALPRIRHSRPADIRAAGWFTPLEIEELKEVTDENQLVRRLAALRMDISREEVLFRHLLSSAVARGEFDVPLLPQSATRIMELNRQPRAAVRDYVKAIEPDTQLVRAILATSQSTVYASVGGHHTLDQAIVRMGVRLVEQIALAHTLSSRLFKVPGHEETLDALTRHNLAVAVTAQGLAARLDASPAAAFLAGLFHDSGKLVLLSIVAQVQRRLSWRAGAELIDSAFDVFHVSVGRLACQRWKFPEEIIAAVGRHHGPAGCVAAPLDQAVYLGNLMAHRLAGTGGADEESWNGDPVVVAVFSREAKEEPAAPETLLAGLDTTFRNL